MKLIRWDKVKRKASELKLRKCIWGGLGKEICCFVLEQNNYWVEYWKDAIKFHHKKEPVKSVYDIDDRLVKKWKKLTNQSYSYNSFIREKSDKLLLEEGVYMILSTENEIVEIRFLKPELFSFLKDS